MTPLDPTIALILLAAGRSERFGSEKLVAAFSGRPLWQWAARAAQEAGFRHLYFVTSEDSTVEPPERWTRVVNRQAALGMGSSIAAGVAAASAHRRVVVALADMPLVPPSHLRLLAGQRGAVFTRQADGSEGSPAGFDREHFAALQGLSGERGARSLPLGETAIIDPPSPQILSDIDTPTDLAGLGPAG